jgi:hypothetical protein
MGQRGLTNRLKSPGSATSTTTTGPNERQRTQKAATQQVQADQTVVLCPTLAEPDGFVNPPPRDGRRASCGPSPLELARDRLGNHVGSRSGKRRFANRRFR